jgi:parvulin-like peptidyl-prolyl isomerase
MTRPLVLLLALASLAAGRTAAAAPPQTNSAPTVQPSTPAGDSVVAKGKGFEIKRSQLDQEVAHAKWQADAQGRPVLEEEKLRVQRQVLEQLINARLLVDKATDADKAAGKAKAEKRLADAKAKAGSAEAFAAELTRLNTTEAEVMAKWIKALTADIVVKRDLKINVTDQDARKEYDANPDRFQEPETIRIGHILLATRDRKTREPFTPDQQAAQRKAAEGVLKRARAGEDFAKLAREFSDDIVSKYKGGEYVFARGQMVPEVEAAAFALGTNQISDIVISPYGYHIIKLYAKIPPHKIPFADAATGLRNDLIQQALQKQFPDYIAKIRQEAGVEILDEYLKPREGVDPESFLKPVKKSDLIK